MSKELRQLWENISSGNYKQAQVKLNKELKKQPKNAYYLAVSAYILNKTNKLDQALEGARRIASTSPANAAVLSVLADVYTSNGLFDEFSTMMETAHRKDPDNGNIMEIWQTAVLEHCHVKGIQKFTMANQKISGRRTDQFSAVLSMYLAHKDEKTDQMSKQLYPMLGAKFLEKLEPMQNPQEAYVKAVCLTMSSQDKLVEFLKGRDAKQWGSLDLDVMLMQVLEDGARWTELFDESKQKVEKGSDNYIHWKALSRAAVELGRVEEVKPLLAGESRNALLATVDLCSRANSGLLEAAKTYMYKMGKNRVAYMDLSPYLEQLNSEEFIERLEEHKAAQDCQTMGSMNWLVNIARIKFKLGIEDDSNVKMYKKTEHLLQGKDEKDYHSGCDFLLIEASKLVSQGELVKAVILLEYAVKGDRFNFYARAMLVQVYTMVGAGVPAMGHYNELSIKMIQEETLSYLLNTRMGTLFPGAAGFKSLSNSLEFYDQTEQFAQFILAAFQRASYTQVEGFIDLRNRLVNSLNYKLLHIEQVKAVRLSGAKKGDPSIAEMEKTNGEEYLHDNRDFKSMWALATKVPVPGEQWAKIMMLREQVVKRLLNAGDELSSRVNSLKQAMAGQNELTEAEAWSVDTILRLAESAANKNNGELYKQVLVDVPATADTINWEYYHKTFTILETCKLVFGYITRLRGAKHQIKFSSEGCDDLHKTATQVVDNHKAQALELKNARNSRYRQQVDELGPWIESQFVDSVPLAEQVCDKIQASFDTQLTFVRAFSATA